MNLAIRTMTPADYEVVIVLWRSVTGIGIHEADDNRDAIERYLARNPGLSLVAHDDGQLVAAVLCGHDGRRGYLHHLAVAPAHRTRGIASKLVDECLRRLAAAGISKCNIFVYTDNEDGQAFWRRTDWKARPDLTLLQKSTPDTGPSTGT